jgi:hypothetical protein
MGEPERRRRQRSGVEARRRAHCGPASRGGGPGASRAACARPGLAAISGAARA